jgi:hypothetical protein
MNKRISASSKPVLEACIYLIMIANDEVARRVSFHSLPVPAASVSVQECRRHGSISLLRKSLCRLLFDLEAARDVSCTLRRRSNFIVVGRRVASNLLGPDVVLADRDLLPSTAVSFAFRHPLPQGARLSLCIMFFMIPPFVSTQ